MPVTTVDVDHDALTVTLVAELEATPEAAWQLWADPRRLERWWGPPSHPATVVDHDLTPGGRVSYHMTGPGGERYPGWWQVLEVDPPRRLVLEDGFGEDADHAQADLPVTRTEVTLTERPGGTTMVVRGICSDPQALRTVLEMGMVEGLRSAAGQMDAVVAELVG